MLAAQAVLDWNRPDGWQPWIAGLSDGCRNEDTIRELRTRFGAFGASRLATHDLYATYGSYKNDKRGSRKAEKW